MTKVQLCERINPSLWKHLRPIRKSQKLRFQVHRCVCVTRLRSDTGLTLEAPQVEAPQVEWLGELCDISRNSAVPPAVL